MGLQTTIGGSPTGSAGGSLGGTFPNPTVLKVGASNTVVSAFAETLLDDATASNARTTLGLGTAATSASTDFATAAQGIVADTGWTANSTAGDKTAVLAAFTNGLDATMTTALNVVSSGAGTALSAALDTIALLVKKTAALETALVASKRPNA